MKFFMEVFPNFVIQGSAFTTPIDTDVIQDGPPDRSTPRAQTRNDYEEDTKRRSMRASANLAGMVFFMCQGPCTDEYRYSRK